MASTNFRELDDEFMQKQAKVWLEAVLYERFGSTQCLADLLADGDILYRVSRSLKELLRATLGAAVLPETPLVDGKGGKYLPYSRVDAFLQTCKTVGLPDVDLFTPPDVVEKKDIRRVCFCVRALSKKARASKLQVPDFDKVEHSNSGTLLMPTEKVGGIREHLQQAAVANTPPSKPPKPANSVQNQSECESQSVANDEESSNVLLDKFEEVAAEEQEAKKKERRGGWFWLPLALGAAFALAMVALRPKSKGKGKEGKEEREVVIEVKEGDTLSEISRRCGKSNWKELLELNPNLANPDLIYPTDRLKLA